MFIFLWILFYEWKTCPRRFTFFEKEENNHYKTKTINEMCTILLMEEKDEQFKPVVYFGGRL